MAQIRHAIERARERYGIELDHAGIRAVEARLEAGEGMLLRRNIEDGSEVTVIRIEGQLVTVACIPHDHYRIKTVMAPNRKRPPKRRRAR